MIMEVGMRIVCDQDGELIAILGEMTGDVLPRKEIIQLHCIDLEYGALDLSKCRILGIDIQTMSPRLEEISVVETAEERRIRELEDALLLQAEDEIGGIL